MILIINMTFLSFQRQIDMAPPTYYFNITTLPWSLSHHCISKTYPIMKPCSTIRLWWQIENCVMIRMLWIKKCPHIVNMIPKSQFDSFTRKWHHYQEMGGGKQTYILKWNPNKMGNEKLEVAALLYYSNNWSLTNNSWGNIRNI